MGMFSGQPLWLRVLIVWGAFCIFPIWIVSLKINFGTPFSLVQKLLSSIVGFGIIWIYLEMKS